MLIFSPHNLNLCLDSQETRFLWNIFEAVQNTRSTCFIEFKNTAARVLNSTLHVVVIYSFMFNIKSCSIFFTVFNNKNNSGDYNDKDNDDNDKYL